MWQRLGFPIWLVMVALSLIAVGAVFVISAYRVASAVFEAWSNIAG